MFVRVSNIFSGLLSDLWSYGTLELGNRNYDIRKDTSFCVSGEDKKRSGRETMKKTFRNGLWMVTWWILSELFSCLCFVPSELNIYLLYHEAHEILSILQRPKARASLSSGHTSVSVSSYNVPEPNLAEASQLPIDDRSLQKPSENFDTRESTKNAEKNQSIALTQCDLVQMQLNLILLFRKFTMSMSYQITDLFQLWSCSDIHW